MGYVQRNLMEGERVVYRTKLHPVIFVWLVIFLLVTLLLVAESGFDTPAQIFLGFAFVVGFVVFTNYFRSELAVTNRRIFGKNLFSRHSGYPDVNLIEIREAQFRPGHLDRFFDYGTVVITERQGARHRFSFVPDDFYKQVQAREERARRALS